MKRHALTILALAVWIAAGAPSRSQDAPQPVPLIEREEVRLVTLDLVVEERDADSTKPGWRTCTLLSKDQVRLLVGGRETPIDSFEPWCSQAVDLGGASPAAVPASPADRPRAQRHRYVLYFDLEHLYLAGMATAALAAERWAEGLAQSVDEVMIVEAGHGLRIVRGMRPTSSDLRSALHAVQEDFRREEMWGEGESKRIDEIVRADPDERPTLAASYAGVDRARARSSLEILRDLMSSLGTIEGTKNLVLFADTLRLVPGEEYPYAPGRLADVSAFLNQVAKAANEASVRLYSMQPGAGGRANDADTLLTTETGGRYVERTNRVATVFDRLAEDLSCFYRISFRVKPGFTGRSETIAIRIADDRRMYRVRHRRSLDDPTQVQRDADTLRAAYLRPSSARGFPSAVRAVELFRHPGGARVRIQVEVPFAELLALPVPGPRTDRLQIRVQIGGELVPLRPDGTKGAAADADDWGAVDPTRAPFGFARQSSLTMRRPVAAGEAPGRVVQVIDVDVPPGPYRVVSVVQDQTARTLSSAVTDLESVASSGILGSIGMAIEDPDAIVLQGLEVEGRGGGGGDPAAAPPFLGPKSLIVEGPSVDAGRSVQLFYVVCTSESGGRKRKKHPADVAPFEGWRLEPALGCGDAPGPGALPPRTIPAPGDGESCVPVVESIPAAALSPGPCRFVVDLDRPGAARETRRLEFSVVPPAGDAGPAGRH